MEKFYNKNYKKLLLIPIIILILSIIIIGVEYSQIGDIIRKDVSLQGGVVSTIYSEQGIDVIELEEYLKGKFDVDLFVRELGEFGTGKQQGIIVEAALEESESLELALEEKLGIELTKDNYSSEITGSSLGASFYRQMLIAILVAFVIMGIVVLIAFRSIIPSIAVVQAAFFDMVVTLAVLNLVNFRISIAGIAALLLMIGYSVDTDVLMTTRTLKRKEGSIYERLKSSAKTGLTMTGTTIVALTVAYFVSNSIVLREMFLVLLIGLFADLISTYLGNAGILKWYLSKKNET